MDLFLAYCKKQYKKQRNIVLGIYFLTVLIFYLLFGPKVIHYLAGAEDLYQIDFATNNDTSAFFSYDYLDNRYAKETITTISAGIADQVKNRETIGIFYLYPLENNKFIVVYADKESLHDTEDLYYQKTDAITIKGGFQKIDEEVKQYAFDYLHELDPIYYTNIEHMDEVVVPYVFVSNHIGQTSIILIEAAAYGFIFLFLMIPVFIFLEIRLGSLKATKDSIHKLSKKDCKIINQEFKDSIKFQRIRLGKHLLFYRFVTQYKIFNYQHIVWTYIEKHPIGIFGKYSLYVYTDEGIRHRLIIGNDVKTATRLIDELHQYNPEIIIGYQSQLADKYQISKDEFLKVIAEIKKKESVEEKHEKV